MTQGWKHRLLPDGAFSPAFENYIMGSLIILA
jgi:hypothetical protein